MHGFGRQIPGLLSRWMGAAAVGAGAAVALALVTFLPVSCGAGEAVPDGARREVLAATCASYRRRAGYQPLPADALVERFATVGPDEPASLAIKSRCLPAP